MIRETIVPSIPDIRDDNLKEVLQAVKAMVDVREGRVGDPLDQVVTLRELSALNLVDTGGSTKTSASGGYIPVTSVLPPRIDGYNPATDYTTPPAPTNLRAKGGFTNVYLEWDGAPYRNHGHTEIWRSETDVIGSAVMVGTTAASVYADPAAPDTTYFYWVRFVSAANVTGPYNQTSGTMAATAIDVKKALDTLMTDLKSSQLFVDLGQRITGIESDAYFKNLVAGGYKTSIEQLSATVDRSTSRIASIKAITESQAIAISTLRSSIGTSISAAITTLEQTKIGYATLNSTGLVFDNNGAITDATTTAAWNAANPGNQATWHIGLPFASAVKQVGVSDGSTSLTLEQRFTAQLSTNNQLYGQYTLKIDSNGHVAGFGLASTAVNGTPTSAMIVRADRFAVVGASDTSDGLGTLNPASKPFIVLTTPTVINGKTYPAGTWIDTAFIANATITNAQISDLTADKITAGTLTAAISVSTGMIYGGVAATGIYPPGHAFFGTGFFLGLRDSVYKFYVGSPSQYMLWDGTNLSVKGNINAITGSFRGITIYDNSDNVILSSGAGVNTALLALAHSQVTGLGTLATQNTVSTGQVTGLGGLATQDSVFIGSTVKFPNGTTMNTGDFVNSLSQINSSNISTFIASAAIGSAYIGNAAIATAHIQDAAIGTAKISDAAITTAKIGDAQITTAKIGAAQVDTLKIGTDMVTVLSALDIQPTSALTRGSPALVASLTVNMGAVAPPKVAITCFANFLTTGGYTGGATIHFWVRHVESGGETPSSGFYSSDSTTAVCTGVLASVGAWAQTFQVWAWHEGFGFDFYIGGGNLMVIGAKR